jgi:hypothetical protein
MRRRDVILVAAGATALALLCAGVVLAPIIAESYERPDPAKIRAYRMSLLTDAQVLELHARAMEESAKQKRLADEQDKAFWAERSRAYAECESNPATKLRDPDHCSKPIPLEMLSAGHQSLVETPDALFEGYVMGICSMADSVREAKRYRCLP